MDILNSVHHNTGCAGSVLFEMIEDIRDKLFRWIYSFPPVAPLLPWLQWTFTAIACLCLCTTLLAVAKDLLCDIFAIPKRIFGRFGRAFPPIILLPTLFSTILENHLRDLTAEDMAIGTKILRSLKMIEAFTQKEVEDNKWHLNSILRLGFGGFLDPRQPNLIRWHYSIKLSSMLISLSMNGSHAANLYCPIPMDADNGQIRAPQWTHWTLITTNLFWPWLRLFWTKWVSTPIGQTPPAYQLLMKRRL